MDWSKLVIAIVAGDRREQEIARQAAATGAQVRAYGFPWPERGIPGVTLAADAARALAGARVALFPIPGIAADGALFAPACPSRIVPDRAMLAGMRAPAHIILGWADANLREHGAALGIGFHEYEWDTGLMLMRGPAIVEGLLRVMIENTEITLHDSRVCVVGQGTIGFLVARYLVALGARTHVAARNEVQRAAAFVAGAEVHPLEDLDELAPRLDIVVSTVPAPVVRRAMLERLPAHALVVDLAAPPGGVDREAAQSLGLKFVWARGMGTRAPVTVGRSQWGGIRRRIEAIFGDGA
ncbi:MAG: NAD(P)-binding domain-containing protein [Burkholderiales bacterium]|nr:NAD(P)-binding domain-containing protein [Burkholderiales bacterium]